MCISGNIDSNLQSLALIQTSDNVDAGGSSQTKQNLNNTRPLRERCRKRKSLIVKANAQHFQCSWAKLETWRRCKPIPIRKSFYIPLFQQGWVKRFPRAVESKSNCRRKNICINDWPEIDSCSIPSRQLMGGETKATSFRFITSQNHVCLLRVL